MRITPKPLLSSLRRVSSQQFIPEIDGLRFLAIMPVILTHLSTGFLRYSPHYDEETVNNTDTLRAFLLKGDVGVLIFFVISGFILAIPFARQNMLGSNTIDLRHYFMRRLTRLEPPYLITLTIFLFVHLFIVSQESFASLLPHYIASFFYSHNIVYGYWTPINPVAWSLEIEIQFYLLVPLLTRVFLISSTVHRRVLLVLIIVTAPWIQNAVPLRDLNLHLSILNTYEYFLAGFLLADLYLSESLGTNGVYDLIGLLSLPLIFVLKGGGLVSEACLVLVILLFFISVFRGQILRRAFCNPWITTIGGMCYITYLIHYPLIHLLMKSTSGWAVTGNFAQDILFRILIFLPPILVVCALAFLILEKPFMYPDWPRRFATWLIKVRNSLIRSFS